MPYQTTLAIQNIIQNPTIISASFDAIKDPMKKVIFHDHPIAFESLTKRELTIDDKDDASITMTISIRVDKENADSLVVLEAKINPKSIKHPLDIKTIKGASAAPYPGTTPVAVYPVTVKHAPESMSAHTPFQLWYMAEDISGKSQNFFMLVYNFQ